MKKSTGIISLVLTVAVTAGLLALAAVGVGENKTGAAKNIPLGLDLAGGVSITYQAKGETPSAEEMNDTIYKLQKRVEGYSTEAQVYPQGDDRINIEIPGVTDANAILEELGKPGSLSFQDMSGNELLSGTDIKTAEAKAYKDNLNNTDYEVALTLTDEGAEKFAEATAANIGSRIAIVYDGETISAPTVQTAITNGNAAITNMLKYHGNIENDIEQVLHFYFLQCSIGMSCRELARSFLPFADHTRPFSFDGIELTTSQVKRINAIMQTCGFYDEAGEFSYLVGLPGKSGVGGGIAAVCPRKYAVAVWSPRLNPKGNSVMGMKALELLTTKTAISIF